MYKQPLEERRTTKKQSKKEVFGGPKMGVLGMGVSSPCGCWGFWGQGVKGRPDYCGIETINRDATVPDGDPCKRQTGLLRDWNILGVCCPSTDSKECKRQTGLLRDWNIWPFRWGDVLPPRVKGRPDYCGIETSQLWGGRSLRSACKRQTGLLRDWNHYGSQSPDSYCLGVKGRPDYCGIETSSSSSSDDFFFEECKRQTGLLRDWNILIDTKFGCKPISV